MKKPGVNALLRLAVASAVWCSTVLDAAEVPEGGASDHFEAVSKYIEYGGVFHAYLDIDGDLESIAAEIDALIQSEDMPAAVRSLDTVDILKAVGVTHVKAVGLSSYRRVDGHFINKAFAYIPGGRAGFFKVTGGEPKPFLAHKIAPADADLIVEQDLDLESIDGTVRDVLRATGLKEILGMFDRTMDERVAGPFSVRNLLRLSPRKATVIGRLNRDSRIGIPKGPEIADFDLVIALDGMGWLLPALKTSLPEKLAEHLFQKGDGYTFVPTPPLPEPFDKFSPMVYVADGEDRMFLTTRKSFLDECLAADGAILKNPDFIKATDGLPEEGNGMSYFSPDVSAEITGILESIPDMSETEKKIFMLIFSKLVPRLETGVAHVLTNAPDGILMVSTSSGSHKQLASSVVLTPIAIFASFGVPVFNRVIENSHHAKNRNVARQVALACSLYRIDHGRFPKTLDDLEGEYIEVDRAGRLQWFNPETSEYEPWLYLGKGIRDDLDVGGAVILASPKAYRGKRIIGFADGSVEEVSEEELLEFEEQQTEP